MLSPEESDSKLIHDQDRSAFNRTARKADYWICKPVRDCTKEYFIWIACIVPPVTLLALIFSEWAYRWLFQ